MIDEPCRMTIKPGDQINYVSPFRTGTFDAIVTTANPDGTVDIDVFMPGLTMSRRHEMEPAVHLRRVEFGEGQRARPKI